MRTYAVAVTTALLLAACSEPADTAEESVASDAVSTAEPVRELGTATLAGADGKEHGTAKLTSGADGLSLALALTGLPANEHAIHLHQTGTCDGPDFKSAGGHLNPANKSHGSMSANGQHLGDLPNITPTDGSVNETIALNWAGPDASASIFDDDGTAIVIHEAADDYKTDPSGDAGGRIACGVLTQSADQPQS